MSTTKARRINAATAKTTVEEAKPAAASAGGRGTSTIAVQDSLNAAVKIVATERGSSKNEFAAALLRADPAVAAAERNILGGRSAK